MRFLPRDPDEGFTVYLVGMGTAGVAALMMPGILLDLAIWVGGVFGGISVFVVTRRYGRKV